MFYAIYMYRQLALVLVLVYFNLKHSVPSISITCGQKLCSTKSGLLGVVQNSNSRISPTSMIHLFASFLMLMAYIAVTAWGQYIDISLFLEVKMVPNNIYMVL